MQIPPASAIETAFDEMPNLSPEVVEKQEKELRSAISAARAETLGVAFPLPEEVMAGYTLGLQVARVMIAQSGNLILAKVNPEDVL